MGSKLAAIVAALLGLFGSIPEARAGATVDLMFFFKNGVEFPFTNTVTASPGDKLAVAVILKTDQALTSSALSISYDSDGDDELDVIFAAQWFRGIPLNKAYTEFYKPAFPLSPSTATFAGSFNGATTNPSLPLPPSIGGPYLNGYHVGTVAFTARAGVNSDGADIISGLLNTGIDTFTDAFFNVIDANVRFNAATVNLVPEPATAGLVGLGLLGLVLLRRRRL